MSTNVPYNGERGTGRDDLAEARHGDGVPAWSVTNWYLRASRGCGDNANEGDKTCKSETHVDGLRSESEEYYVTDLND